MTKVEKLVPRFISIGTTTFSSIKGCLAEIKLINLLSFNSGSIALSFIEYFAFANIKSNLPIISVFCFNSFIIG